MDNSVLGWNGERLDPVSGATHLGNGYRAYSPALMRFHCPDSLSPFGAGGVNRYAYCAGDPVNRADPSGHLSWQAWTMIGLGATGLGLAALTAGTSIVASGGIIAALESASAISLAIGGAAAVADAAAIASGIFEESNPKASAILGWVSFSAGMLSLGTGLAFAGQRLLAARDTMTMGLDSEFRFITSLGRTSRTKPPFNTMMSVIFADVFKPSADQLYRRLNIWAHGRELDRICIGGKPSTIDELIDRLVEENIDITDYNVVRFITCNSADLARAFTEKTSMAATGFLKDVTVRGHAVSALKRISRQTRKLPNTGAELRFTQLADLYRDHAILSGIDILEDREFFRVISGSPVSFRSLPEQEEIIERVDGYPPPGWSMEN
ncbi:hypothetical protein CXB49_11780 [Chromobacterium sp. ATCC 53434]|uniref:RHS repeat-associated core domain-containing protein n=1 Tax=Chromobacterium sp. (strain ATCC 53434 / SC 14030) TaxID=2059672 RepID=UPI000C76AB6B|nr:RHS repeat-associated core domain-containing protein [Chromobacterium sp. ATCC 53434]AUH51448.1 hypothetical protein CXB49_11780 [Chromobacterium sp. ATCC 53434]